MNRVTVHWHVFGRPLNGLTTGDHGFEAESPTAIGSQMMHFINQHQLDGRQQVKVFRPRAGHAVPLFRCGHNEVRFGEVGIAAAFACFGGRGRIARNQGHVNVRVQLVEAFLPVDVPFFAQRLAGRQVNHFAGGRQHFGATMMRGYQASRDEPRHGHFKHGGLSGTGRRRHYHIVITVTQHVGHFRLKMIELFKARLSL